MRSPHPDRLIAAALGLIGAAWLLQWLRMWAASGDGPWAWIFPPAVLAYLFWICWKRPTRPAPLGATSGGGAGAVTTAGMVALVLAMLVRPTLEPFPGWPLAEWTYSLLLGAAALLLIALSRGAARAKDFLGPGVFALAALPWPAWLTVGVMGGLRLGMAAIIAEAFTIFGHPAMAAGTAIRFGHADIGIDEACGGIRSLQIAVLLALAIGEMQNGTLRRRAVWVIQAALIAIAANFLRLVGLSFAAVSGGVDAVHRWHDPAAALEFIAVCASLALLAIKQLKRIAPLAPSGAEGMRLHRQPRTELKAHPSTALGTARDQALHLATAVLILLPLAEITTQAWFGSHAARAAHRPAWDARLPSNLATFAEDSWTAPMQDLLHCDSHAIGHWRNGSGALREGYAIDWTRGQTAEYVIAAHNPDICLPLSGLDLVRRRGAVLIRCAGEVLPFAAEEYRGPNGPLFVYYLAWNLTAGKPLTGALGPDGMALFGWRQRWAEIAAGRRRLAARVVAVALFDTRSPADADAAFEQEIKSIVFPVEVRTGSRVDS